MGGVRGLKMFEWLIWANGRIALLVWLMLGCAVDVKVCGKIELVILELSG